MGLLSRTVYVMRGGGSPRTGAGTLMKVAGKNAQSSWHCPLSAERHEAGATENYRSAPVQVREFVNALRLSR